MELRLLEGFYCAERYPLVMRFHHDYFANLLFKLEHSHEDLDNMFHGVHVVIMQEDLVPRYGRGLQIG